MVYLILPGEDGEEIRVPTTKPLNDTVLAIFRAMPDLQDLWVASGTANEPHAWFIRNGDEVLWKARVKSRPNPRPRTVAQSPNANRWVDVGIVTPTEPTPDRDPGPPEDWPDYLEPGEKPSKWDEWFSRKHAGLIREEKASEARVEIARNKLRAMGIIL